MAAPQAAENAPTVLQWVIDTRKLWPEASKTAELSTVASRALSLVSEQERTKALKYYFVKDAKLSLCSSLIKRHIISRYCPGISWDAATAVPDARTKPVFIMPDGSEPLLFNVSHQAGLVVLLAVHAPPPGLAIGVDVVCQGERRQRDLASITKEGWPRYVDMHDEVLSPAEVRWLKTQLPSADADTRLGYFYAAWGLHEAYVKMTGEALLAPWLKDLEMRNFAPTSQAEGAGALEVYFKGQKVEDVEARLDPLLDEYMVATVVKRGKDDHTVDIGEYVLLDVEEVLAAAENSRHATGSSA